MCQTQHAITLDVITQPSNSYQKCSYRQKQYRLQNKTVSFIGLISNYMNRYQSIDFWLRVLRSENGRRYLLG